MGPIFALPFQIAQIWSRTRHAVERRGLLLDRWSRRAASRHCSVVGLFGSAAGFPEAGSERRGVGLNSRPGSVVAVL